MSDKPETFTEAARLDREAQAERSTQATPPAAGSWAEAEEKDKADAAAKKAAQDGEK